MDDYEIVFTRAARKELESLDASFVARIFEKIIALARGPRPRGVKKLQGSETLYRLRIGDYRVVYEVDDKARRVDINAVRHRRDAYR
ncbi:MAG: type II toxin-antitoxin system RelE/ParE family toxin [Planctomycetaceae bacterium]